MPKLLQQHYTGSEIRDIPQKTWLECAVTMRIFAQIAAQMLAQFSQPTVLNTSVDVRVSTCASVRISYE